ncbi:hypothetical protein [Dokdonella sp.]|uniref:hypothetical protein n=1 Tax=Dokdonella sp. TaxID=2291710 RepID=UPI003C5356A1
MTAGNTGARALAVLTFAFAMLLAMTVTASGDISRSGDVAITAGEENQIFGNGFEPLNPSTIRILFDPANLWFNNFTNLFIFPENSNASAVTLTAPLTIALPPGLSPKFPAVSDCPGAAVVTSPTSITLNAGAQIPAGGASPGSCYLGAYFEVANHGIYPFSIQPGGLQTDAGANTELAFANLTYGQAVIPSGPINHTISPLLEGTGMTWSQKIIADGINGLDFQIVNFGGTKLGMRTYWTYTRYGSRAVVNNPGEADPAILTSGATIGPDSIFSGTVNFGLMYGWNAGATGYIGFQFDCGTAISPSGLCYGYFRFSTTAPNGHPATLIDYSYDQTGAAITIP